MGGHYKHVVTVQPKSDDFVQSTNPGSDVLANVNQIVIKERTSFSGNFNWWNAKWPIIPKIHFSDFLRIVIENLEMVLKISLAS